jgi:hypothetical protein
MQRRDNAMKTLNSVGWVTLLITLSAVSLCAQRFDPEEWLGHSSELDPN